MTLRLPQSVEREEQGSEKEGKKIGLKVILLCL